MVPPGNDGTTEVCWGKLKINWNNGYNLYHEGINMVNSEVNFIKGVRVGVTPGTIYKFQRLKVL